MSTAAMGVPKVAAMPPAAPATSSVFHLGIREVDGLGHERAERAPRS